MADHHAGRRTVASPQLTGRSRLLAPHTQREPAVGGRAGDMNICVRLQKSGRPALSSSSHPSLRPRRPPDILQKIPSLRGLWDDSRTTRPPHAAVIFTQRAASTTVRMHARPNSPSPGGCADHVAAGVRVSRQARRLRPKALTCSPEDHLWRLRKRPVFRHAVSSPPAWGRRSSGTTGRFSSASRNRSPRRSSTIRKAH